LKLWFSHGLDPIICTSQKAAFPVLEMHTCGVSIFVLDIASFVPTATDQAG